MRFVRPRPFPFSLSVSIVYLIAAAVLYRLLLEFFGLEGHRGKYCYSFFSFVDSPAELFPLAKRRHKACIGLLEHNEYAVSCGIVREFTHIPQTFLVAVGLENSLNAVIDFLE